MADIKGTDGSDTLKGTDGADTITYGAGDDSVYAGGGDDVITQGTTSATLIAHHDFNDKDTHGWSNATLDNALDDGDIYLGGFGGTSGGSGVSGTDAHIKTEQTFDLDTTKPAMVMEFQFHKLDSWDNENFVIEFNGEKILNAHHGTLTSSAASTSYTHSDGTTYDITFTQTAAGDLGGYGPSGWQDATYDVKITAENPPETLKVGFGSTLNQGATDESFGIDDFKLASTDSTKVDIQDPASFKGNASGNNEIYAGTGDDDVTGGTGSDTIDGGEGDDTITGGLGADKLTGGKGADTFKLTSGDTTDIITDFDAGESTFDTFEMVDVSMFSSDLRAYTLPKIDAGDGSMVLSVFPTYEQFGGFEVTRDISLKEAEVTKFNSDSPFKTTDQLDVSQLTGGSGKDGAVRASDVKVTEDGFGNAQLIFPGGETLILEGVSAKAFDTTDELIGAGIPCFTAGTRLLTPDGYRPVESLRPGDAVLTERGAEALLWVGQRHLTRADLARRPQDRPIILRPGALGDHKRLRLSGQHAVRIGQTLVRAKHLAQVFGGKVARVDTKCDHVTYVHVFTRRHSIVTAEGVQAETFWPGPMGLAALSGAGRLSLIAAYPAIAHSLVRPAELHRVYGDPAYPYLSRQDVGRHLVRPPASSPATHLRYA